ncbi:sensor histidine kinase [Agromyces sp. NPDC058064]|uniref:sensor histidine kinase n=1 Tax=Agromyces sp. NPDC058064 TaxID=3346322 RepID=UPI0036DEB107
MPTEKTAQGRSPDDRATIRGASSGDLAPRASAVPSWTSPLDLAIAGGIGLWATLEAVLVPSSNVAEQLLFALAVSAPLVVRRRFPALVLVAIAAALVAHAALAGPDATFNPFPSLLVATFTVAERIASWWIAGLLGLVPIGAMLAAHSLGYFGSPGIETAGTVFLVFFVGATWAAGRIVRHRALTLQRTRDSSDRLAADAVAVERTRIARELHDIVAHALSIVALQAGAAEQFLDKDVERARRHLGLTRRTAQEALDEMRHLLGVLREDGVDYAPQPGLSGLPDLIAETEAAGHPCRIDVDPGVGDVPDGHALAVYRIVQESLTNVRKHAPGAEAAVGVLRRDRAIVVDVVNGPARKRPASPGLPTEAGGRGLLGMGERVRVYGGTLEYGAEPDGGWRVHVELPMGGS